MATGRHKKISAEFTVNQVMDLLNGIGELDGRNVVVTDENGMKSVAKEWYTIDFGSKLAIAKNRAELDRVVKVYNQSRDDLILQITGGKSQTINVASEPDKANEFNARHKQMLESPIKVDLYMIPISVLEGIDLSPSTLSRLIPIIDEDETVVAMSSKAKKSSGG